MASSPLTSVSFHWPTRLSWSAIIAGCVAALSLHLLLIMLGMSMGIALIDPSPGERDWPELSAAAGIAWSVSALISLWIGGWIAGRTGRRGPGNSGGIHGVLVWSVATVVSFGVVTGGTSMLVGGAAKMAGRGAALAAGQTGAALLDVSQPAGLLANFVEEIVPANPETRPRNDGPSRAQIQRDLAYGLRQLFSGDDADAANIASARAALVRVLVETGQTQASAEATVQRWEESYERAVDNAEVIAARAAKRSAVLAAWTVAAFALGAFFAAWGGRCGANRSAKLDVAEAEADYVAVP